MEDLAKDLDTLKSKIEREQERLKKISEAQHVDLSLLKKKLQENIAFAIEDAFKNYLQPKRESTDYSKVAEWMINYLNINEGKIFSMPEIRAAIPMVYWKEFGDSKIRSFVSNIFSMNYSGIKVIELPADSLYVTNLGESEEIDTRYYKSVQTRGKMKFVTSVKKEPDAFYFK